MQRYAIDPEKLRRAFVAMLRQARPEKRSIARERVSLLAQMDYISRQIKERGELLFLALCHELGMTREVIIVTFLADPRIDSPPPDRLRAARAVRRHPPVPDLRLNRRIAVPAESTYESNEETVAMEGAVLRLHQPVERCSSSPANRSRSSRLPSSPAPKKPKSPRRCSQSRPTTPIAASCCVKSREDIALHLALAREAVDAYLLPPRRRSRFRHSKRSRSSRIFSR